MGPEPGRAQGTSVPGGPFVPRPRQSPVKGQQASADARYTRRLSEQHRPTAVASALPPAIACSPDWEKVRAVTAAKNNH